MKYYALFTLFLCVEITQNSLAAQAQIASIKRANPSQEAENKKKLRLSRKHVVLLLEAQIPSNAFYRREMLDCLLDCLEAYSEISDRLYLPLINRINTLSKQIYGPARKLIF